MKKLTTIFTILISVNSFSQERITLQDFNGIWRNTIDTNHFYIFKNGDFIDTYITLKKAITFKIGKFGFHDNINNNSINLVNLKSELPLSKTKVLALLYNNGTTINYEFDLEQTLSLTNQNEFYFKRIKNIPQNRNSLLQEEFQKNKIKPNKFIE